MERAFELTHQSTNLEEVRQKLKQAASWSFVPAPARRAVGPSAIEACSNL